MIINKRGHFKKRIGTNVAAAIFSFPTIGYFHFPFQIAAILQSSRRRGDSNPQPLDRESSTLSLLLFWYGILFVVQPDESYLGTCVCCIKAT